MLLFLLISFQWLAAQTGTVKGTVKDAAGNPLAGASVTVQGKKTGTISEANGNYSITLAPGRYSIIASYVGQQTQKTEVLVTAGNATEQNFITENASDLDNVVVLGSRVRDMRGKICKTEY